MYLHRWVQTVSLGNLFQYFIILRVKVSFLTFKWNFLYFNWCPLPLVLSLDWDANSKQDTNENCYSERAAKHRKLSHLWEKRVLWFLGTTVLFCLGMWKVSLSSLLFSSCPFKTLAGLCEHGKHIHASFICKFYSMFHRLKSPYVFHFYKETMPVSSPRQLYFSFRQMKKGLTLNFKQGFLQLPPDFSPLLIQATKQTEGKNPNQQFHESHGNYFVSKDMIDV